MTLQRLPLSRTLADCPGTGLWGGHDWALSFSPQSGPPGGYFVAPGRLLVFLTEGLDVGLLDGGAVPIGGAFWGQCLIVTFVALEGSSLKAGDSLGRQGVSSTFRVRGYRSFREISRWIPRLVDG